MKIESYGISNVGMKRNQNEDSYLINDEICLYMVADGMGGHLGGEYASKLAVGTVEEIVHALRFDPDATQILGVNTEGSSPGHQLRHAIQEASRRIHDQALYDVNLRGMGTTAVAALFISPHLYIANVGDSRAYRLREGKIEQITEDHSLVSEQVKAGMISAADARGHKLKNIITRSVGYQEEVDIDLLDEAVRHGDKYLLCSDGLSNLVDDQEIERILQKYDLREACEKLINSANSRGGDDNITVILLQVDDIA
ncbi:MAG TPA: Stp1/IreP family PP2C-type Ser/Thr phosphatase [Deltaproteobacteria bacterium]|nr:Stp1/IreP family PP2C-type Ser/Thr phosphatase [Deltaproteobacteria bacterium]